MFADLKKTLHTFMLYLRVRFWQFKRFFRENFTAEGRQLRESFEKARAADVILSMHPVSDAVPPGDFEAPLRAFTPKDIEDSGHIDRMNYCYRGWFCVSCGGYFGHFVPKGGYPVCTGPRKTLSPRLQEAVDRMKAEDEKLLYTLEDVKDFGSKLSKALVTDFDFHSNVITIDSFPKAVKKTKSAKKRVAAKKSKSRKKSKK